MARKQFDRDVLRKQAMALIALNEWNRQEASVALGVSSTTLVRMEKNGDRWAKMARQTLERLAGSIDAQSADIAESLQAVSVTPTVEPVADTDLIPITGNTGMLNERTHEGRPVYTIADVAEGLGVHFSTVWRHWGDKRDEFRPGTDVVCISANGREQPVFMRPGVMLLSMSIGGERAKAVRAHLRDIESAVHAGPAILSTEQQIMANVMTAMAGQLTQAFGAQTQAIRADVAEVRQIAAAQDERLTAIESRPAGEVNEESIAQKAALIQQAYQDECSLLSGQLEKIVQEYAELRELSSGEDTHEIFSKANSYLKKNCAQGKPRKNGWTPDEYRASIACVSRWMIRMRNSDVTA